MSKLNQEHIQLYYAIMLIGVFFQAFGKQGRFDFNFSYGILFWNQKNSDLFPKHSLGNIRKSKSRISKFDHGLGEGVNFQIFQHKVYKIYKN